MRRKRHKFKVHVPLGLSFVFHLAFMMPVGFAHSDLKHINLTYSIEPVTVLTVVSSRGTEDVDLGRMISGTEQPSESLEVKIITNSNNPYQVYHELRNPILSGDGTALPESNLQFRATNGSNGGASQISSFAPVPEGRTLIFRSDPSGGEDSFSVQYTIGNDQLLAAGHYFGSVHLHVEQG